jgi:beta-lactamase regulating signal transducer with metallopeptidase domain
VTNPELIRVLGLCLMHFVWQGALLALVLCALLSCLRSPQARYVSAVCALAAMMIAPLVTFVILEQPREPVPQFALSGLGEIRNGIDAMQAVAASPRTALTSPTIAIDWMSYAVLAWLAGVYMFTLRTLGGWMLLMRLRRQSMQPIAGDLLETFLALQRRLGVSRAVRYVCSKAADSPAVFGWWRPVVVLPLAAIAGLSPWQIEAIIAHELAHIKRWDLLVNAFQIATETLLFYHPAVWWVNRVIRNEREHCCDDVAVQMCGNAHDYARGLAQLEESRSTSVFAMAANGGVLRSRIGRLLGLNGAGRTMSAGGLAVIGSLCVAGVLMAGTTVAQLQSAAPAEPAAALFAPEVQAPGLSVHIAPRVYLSRHVHLARLEAADATAPNRRSRDAAPKAASNEEHGSYIEGLQSAGLKDLTVDQIITLKIHGVTPDYIRELRAAGVDAGAPEIVALKIHEVTPEYVRGLAAAGFANLHVHDYLAAKIQGVTPEFIQGIRSHGFKDLTLHQLIALKMADIS